MVTLTATNNGDGTVTVTVSGSSGGLVIINYGKFSLGLVVWELFTTQVGDGPVTIVLPDGFYLFYAVDGTDVSPVVSSPVTGTDIAVLTEVRISIAAVINSLGLGLLGGVQEQWAVHETNVMLPAVILTHANTTPTREQKFVGTTDVGYPNRVMICDRVEKYDSSNMPRYDLWRQKIGLAFDGQRLPGVRQVMICQVEDDNYSENVDNAYEFMVSQLVIRVFARHPVGVS